MPAPLVVSFVAGPRGNWRVRRVDSVVGDGLPVAERLAVIEEPLPLDRNDTAWILRGGTSNPRYTHRADINLLSPRQQGRGRVDATCAALIPIRKTEAWWVLAQDERTDETSLIYRMLQIVDGRNESEVSPAGFEPTLSA